MIDQTIPTAQKIGRIADKLRDVANTGTHFAKNPYDCENYAVIQETALELMSIATGTSLESLEPIRDDFIAAVGPIPTVDAAIINEHEQILLIRRKDNGHWAMPGGKIEVGELPAAAAEREAREETGVTVKATALVGIFDSYKHHSSSAAHLYQFVFLCHPLDTKGSPDVH